MSGPAVPYPAPVATLLTEHPGVRFLDAFFPDLSGLVRGKRLPIAQAAKAFDGGIAAPGSSFLLAVTGDSLDPAGMGFSDGDPDQLGLAVPGTLAPMPWAQPPAAQVLLTFSDPSGTPYYYEPRNVLRRVLERFAGTGLTPVVAFELEFYLLDPEPAADGSPQPPRDPHSGQRPASTQVYGLNEIGEFAELLADIDSACQRQGVPTQALTSEYAPGQFEINLQHRADALRAADDCVLFKRCVQGVARQHGARATFMAKPYAGQSGSGMHLHVSLLDRDGRNVLDGGGASATPASLSETARHALGGLLHSLPEAMAVFAPNLNAFRRFEPDIYVPVNRSWGFENRSVALRVPTGPGEARRIEHRVPGADANPYLALAAVLAGIHDGIENRRECGPEHAGNVGSQSDAALAQRLRPALERLRAGEVLNDYLGAPYVSVYCACKEKELDAFERRISPAEYDWYLLT